MKNFDEVQLIVKAHIVIKKGKEKELIQNILKRFPDFLNTYYATENLEVTAYKITGDIE